MTAGTIKECYIRCNCNLQLVFESGRVVTEPSQTIMATATEASLRKAFTFFDKDGSGTVTIDELTAILGNPVTLAETRTQDCARRTAAQRS